jgi:hypothetical protein
MRSNPMYLYFINIELFLYKALRSVAARAGGDLLASKYTVL